MSWTGEARIRGTSQFVRMLLVSICVAGLQFTWGVEQSYVNVYLLSLGMSKAMLSIVWIAGPISGLVMQPIVGVLSDSCTSKYGRRRPYMVIGSFVVTAGLVCMAWARELAQGVLLWPDGDSETLKYATLVIATISIFVTDFAINAVQTCCRAIIVDTLPPEDQELGNGWAGRMIASGHLLGYFLGTLDLVYWTGGLAGDTQLKALCVLSSLGLLIAVGITCYSVEERVLVLPAEAKPQSVGAIALDVYTKLQQTAKKLPPRIATIFKVQLFAWYGWFCFLFYASTWVGEVYMKYGKEKFEQLNDSDKVGRVARKGSAALLAFSCVSLAFSIILPEMLKLTKSATTSARSCVAQQIWIKKLLAGTNYTLVDLWFVSHIAYSVAVLSTGFVTSYSQAMAVAAVCGFSWAITTWAPFALLAEEIWQIAEESPQYTPIVTDDEPIGEPSGELSGIYLGLHNVAITVPQLVATFVSFVIYSVLDATQGPDYKEGQDGGRAIAYTLQLGALTALGAAYYCRQLKKC